MARRGRDILIGVDPSHLVLVRDQLDAVELNLSRGEGRKRREISKTAGRKCEFMVFDVPPLTVSCPGAWCS